jgi:LmbE family N-acetylglucosaminyl deacetylase
MLPLLISQGTKRPLRILAVGAHPDDIEIGAGGTLLSLAAAYPTLRAHLVVLTGSPDRQEEARNAADAFLPTADVSVELHPLPEGRLPAHWELVKDVLEGVAAESDSPDIVFAPCTQDAHQDHRTIAEIVPTVFRDSLSLAYEIPKWDGDMRRQNVYIPLPGDAVRRKVELLHKSFPSQKYRDWWDDDVFVGLARLRGIECRVPYAEAFTCTKALLSLH